MRPSYFKLKPFILAVLGVCFSLSGLHALAAECPCSNGEKVIEQQAKHECTCHNKHKTYMQKVINLFKGTYVRTGLEMIKYTKVVRSNNPIGLVGGIGYSFTNTPFRLEMLVQYNSVKFKPNTNALKAKARTFFVNGYYDFTEEFQLKHMTPYFTVGAGKTKYYDGTFAAGPKQSSTMVNHRITKTKTAWNAGIGLKFDLNKNFAIDAGYRYLVLGRFISTTHVKGHQGLLSAIFTL